MVDLNAKLNDVRGKLTAAAMDDNFAAAKRAIARWEKLRVEKKRADAPKHVSKDFRVAVINKAARDVLPSSGLKIYNNKLKNGRRSIKIYLSLTAPAAKSLSRVIENRLKDGGMSGFEIEIRSAADYYGYNKNRFYVVVKLEAVA